MDWKKIALFKIAQSKIDDINLDVDVSDMHAGFDDEDEVMEFHSLWYKSTYGPDYGVPKDIVSEWHSDALSIGHDILDKFQDVLKHWYILHKYDDPTFMWRKRIELGMMVHEDSGDEFESLADFFEREMSTDLMFDWEDVGNNIDGDMLYQFWQYLGYDEEFLLKEEPDSPDEKSELEKYQTEDFSLSEEEIKSRLYDYVTDIGVEQFFHGLPGDLMYSGVVKNLLIKCYVANHDEQIQRWEINKNNSSTGNTEYSFKEITDLAGAQMVRNEQALASGDLGQIASAISLTLNLKHNFGNLIADHMDMSDDLLNALHMHDWSEEEEELKRLGRDYSGMFSDTTMNRKPDFDLQHDYYKQKDHESYEHRMKKFDDPSQAPEWMKMPLQGAGLTDWRTKFIKERNKGES